jgi:hypothetical protein
MSEAVVDDNLIRNMVHNPVFTEIMPFLKTMVVTRKSGCCGRKKTISTPDFEGIKKAVATMAPSAQATLKSRLNVDQVTVKFKKADGTWAKVTF